ncbi:hypothetical protein ACH5RR_005251 [Cinchona calisaya]|uniref:F-box domain-containing protein n=1 Tax=Cinchona calisaya TaxID=153742 RepID=A0ABD3AKN6_9GENT
MWEEIPEILDDFMDEEVETLKNIKARYEKNIARKDVEKGGEMERASLTDLPEGIIFDILVKVPPGDVYKNGRLVCRAWREIISRDDFVAQNFIESKGGLLVGGPTSHKNQYFEVKLMEIEGTQLDYKLLDFGLCRMGCARSSCNGLLLVNHPKQKGLLQVMNLITTVGLTLPKCPSGCPHKACGSALGFDPNKKEYKVVHMYADAFGFEIFNLGCPDATWKRIPGPWNGLQERPFNFENFSWSDPVSVNGRVLHWYVASDKYIISMDVSEEISIKTYLPYTGEEIEKDRYTLVELGGDLSFVYSLSDIQVDVWTLDDFREQIWSKRHSIQLELINYMMPENLLQSTKYTIALPNLSKLVTVASEGADILILKHDNSCLYMYDMRHRVLKKFKMNMKSPMRFIPHRSSLLHWKTLKDS